VGFNANKLITQQLHRLKKDYGLVSLKAGTEWEDMDYQEIQWLYDLDEAQLPILVKVAGPEARVDLRHLQAIGVTGLLGPMIESTYAMEKFVNIAKAHYQNVDKKPLLAINLETIHAHDQLDTLIASPAFADIELVVIGRLDLSLSMGIDDVDHPAVLAVTQTIVNKVRAAGKAVSIGGFVNPASAASICQTFNINYLNTIHTLFDPSKTDDIATAIWLGIEFEIAFYQYLKTRNPARSDFYQSRMDTSQAKLDKAAKFNPHKTQAIAA
jgi:4-hydroxy-2-oxoheptanedioate aldolase